MRICIIVDDYLPASKKVAGKMMHELAEEFISNGHLVTVVTPSFKMETPFNLSKLNSVKVCRFNSGEIKNVSKLKRAINESLLSFRAWNACKKYFRENKHDLIVYYSPSIFWGPLVWRLKNLWGASTYLVLRDFYPQMFFDEGLINKYSPIAFYFRFFEWLCYLPADKIGIESPKNLEWFSRRKYVKKPLKVLYNWATNKPINSENEFRNKLNLQNKIIFFYGGNIGPQQDMMNLIRLVKSMIDEKKAHFVIIGDGFALKLLKNKVNSLNLNNLTLLPSVSQEEYKKMLSEFDVGLFSLNKNHTTHNIPGKLLGYMVQSKPVLGSINKNNDIKEIIEKANAGFITINGDDETFIHNAKELVKNKNLRNEMGKNSNKLLMKTFSVEEAARNILEKNL